MDLPKCVSRRLGFHKSAAALVVATCMALMLTLVTAGRLSELQSASSITRTANVPVHVAPPAFPDAYEMTFTFEMPYFKLLQPGGLSYDVHVWVDREAESVRVDMRGGVDKTLFIKSKEYAITPHKYELVCAEYKHSGGGPVATAEAAGPASMLGKQVLPDMRGWTYLGPADVDGTSAHAWQLKEMAGEKVNTYSFYVSEAGAPLRLHSVGQDFFQGSHYDEYIYTFTSFKPGPIRDSSVFQVPDLCTKARDDGSMAHVERQVVSRRAASLLPGNHAEHKDEAHYHAWSEVHSRNHGSTSEFSARLSAFTAAKARIMAHNAAAASGGPDAPAHTLALNRFADWSREEFDRVMLPKKWRRERGLGGTPQQRPPPLYTFRASMDRGSLPKQLDWRATPADYAVKDQGQCGSCWAFAAVGTMEGAWYVHTGSARSFSEQQLVSCAWDQGPHGCDGGDYQPAFRYVKAAGGIASTLDYPYVGQNDWCRDNSTAMSGHFDGYVEVASKDEVAVMEALWRHGPLAVGIDASFDEFLFYSEGVYRNRRCTTKPLELDHAVVLTGYGTDPVTGEDYWIIKNSWSKLWGNDGYVKVHRGGNDCGVASDAAFAAVSPADIVPGAAEAARAAMLAAAGGAAQKHQFAVV